MNRHLPTPLKYGLPAFIAGVLLLLAACQKYEQGPLISFKSVEERLINDWQVEYAEDLSKVEEYTHVLHEKQYALSMHVNGRFTLVYVDQDTVTVTGTWELRENKTKIIWQHNHRDPYGLLGEQQETSVILKLKDDVLWLRNAANTRELHFITR